MKAMKGRILNKLKSIPQMQLKQSRILQLKASSNGFFFNSPPPPSSHLLDCRDQPQIMDEVELMRDFDDDEEEEDKENIKPASTTRSSIPWRKQNNDEHDHKFYPYRRPNLNSPTLFDPNLLAAFEQAVKDYFRFYELLKQMEEKGEERRGQSSIKDPQNQRPIEGIR